ncbi:hypothetical protein B9Z19DRAFT_1122606 [Tuber borchii]|uniref:UBA domain-containing protein n=1 Tax=Tuber borchii TaxID=42251 RepID=A0A2T7A028_TUBBO|nr:hypothetical protein B9Z19DRAFT_1122606 [Tuber borchii]
MEPDAEEIRQLVEMGFTWQNTMTGLLLGKGNVNTTTEWLTSQGVRTPQLSSQISTSGSGHSTGEEGTDVDVAWEESIVPAYLHLYRVEPQASESAEISPSTVEKGKAKEGEKVEPLQVLAIEELHEL